MARPSDITPQAAMLSQAARRAIEAIGGLENAAQVTSRSTSQLSRCQSANEDDTLSLRDAFALDDATTGRGGPHILRQLARMLGHEVIAIPTTPSDREEVKAQLMAVMTEVGDVSAEVIEAERDGVWTQAEARRALARTDELLSAVSAMRSLFTALAYPVEAERQP